jgi:hypothetical protein
MSQLARRASRCSLLILAAFFLVGMEWLFFATRPSFLSNQPLTTALDVLFASALPLYAIGTVAFLLMLPLDRLFRESQRFIPSRAPAALILAISFLLLLDNFTSTVLQRGIRETAPPFSWLYLAALGFLFWVALGLLRGAEEVLVSGRWRRAALGLASCFLGLSLLAALLGNRASLLPQAASTREHVNVLILGSDGVEAEDLGPYGGSRETTPFLTSISGELLRFENAFANCDHTGGSIASLLTGRLPTTTRLIYPPDILHGDDAYRHLPAVLRRAGYRLIDIGVRHFSDPYDLNLRDSFHVSNGRQLGSSQSLSWTDRILPVNAAYLDEQILDRVVSRVRHIVGSQPMSDAWDEVTGKRTKWLKDKERLAELFRFLDAEDSRPFFAHVHLMGTHGSSYGPKTIRRFDNLVGRTFSELSDRGLLAETLVVLYSDHGHGHGPPRRLPLLFRLPGGEPSEAVGATVSNLDIAPSVLHYLELPVPSWMEGRSLLRSDQPPNRPAFSTALAPGSTYKKGGPRQVDPERAGPPFYSLGSVTTVICDAWYRADLRQGTLQSGLVAGHTAPCSEKGRPSKGEAWSLIREHLAARGYDVGSLEPGIAPPEPRQRVRDSITK